VPTGTPHVAHRERLSRQERGLGDAIGGVRNQLGRLGDELSRWEKLGREIAFDG